MYKQYSLDYIDLEGRDNKSVAFLIQEALKGWCYLTVCTFIFLRTKDKIPVRNNPLKYSL